MSLRPSRSHPLHQPAERDEGPSPEDIEAFSDVTRPCPKCKAELYDDVEICWKCGHALSSRSDGMVRAPVWAIVLIVLVLGALVIALMR